MDNIKKDNKRERQQKQKFNPIFIVWIIVLITLGWLFITNLNRETIQNMSDGELYRLLKTSPLGIHTIEKEADILHVQMSDEKKYRVIIPETDTQMVELIRESGVDFTNRQPRRALQQFLLFFGPTILFIFIIWLLFFRGAVQGGAKIFSFGRSGARMVAQAQNPITFKDVAGVDEAKEEMQEIIEFLKDPKKFQKLGGRIPKGVLLMGAPGTGKTLLAKAVAGEAGVPFFSISGSDFVEMFVGVGASRVRDLFEQAKRATKTIGKGCIVFIDEIDAVGRQRFAGLGGGHDEREQTLNALLVEMDGFDTQEGIICVAATNRPDVLDPALLRRGRFDRQIVINRPDILGREAILNVHIKKVKPAKDVDIKSIARQTSGFSGADLANLVNEAALLAARKGKEDITILEFQAAIERVIAGPEKKSRIISPHERQLVAYHESGHALLALLIPGSEPLHKVSMIPRGLALGYTMRLPTEDRYIISKNELLGRVVGLLGGRTSEELIFNEITTGAANDLDIATEIVRHMVCEYGMAEGLGLVTLGKGQHQVFLGRDLLEERNYSEKTAQVIDEEIHRLLNTAYTRAKQVLSENLDKLKILATTLMEKEVLEMKEVEELLGLKIVKV